MKRLSTIELLGIWETYRHHSVLERSLYLLSAIYLTDVSTVAKMSIGDRDASLLNFREWIFGSRFINIANCPHCAAAIEWETDIEDLKLQEVLPGTATKILKMEEEGFKIDFRLPNSYDMIQVISNPAIAGDPSKIIAGCILHVEQDQKEFTKDKLPQKIIEGIGERMSAADPQADIKMVLSCPDCNNQWEAPFDILNYLWTEIDSWAKRVIKEVAVLARAFSWREEDILNLSPQRRQLYLELVRG